MFSRRDVIEGAFERKLNDNEEEDILGEVDTDEVKFHYFGSLEDYSEETLISDEIDEIRRHFSVLAVPFSRESAFVMNNEDVTSSIDEESLAKIHEMSQEFKENNLNGPKLVRK